MKNSSVVSGEIDCYAKNLYSICSSRWTVLWLIELQFLSRQNWLALISCYDVPRTNKLCSSLTPF